MSESNGIEVRSLRKEFDSVAAVDDISFEVRRGEVFGFLGPNGAGKTTTIKMLTTLIPPTSGGAHVLGLDIARDGPEIRSRSGVVQQGESYEYSLRGEDALDLYGMMWDVPKPERRRRVAALLDAFDLQEHRRKRPSELSLGLKRRLQVAREFMHDMDLLFLDEPTVGLDPLVRRATLDMIRGHVEEGLTVFFTTHVLEEAEYICDRIAIINRGRIVAMDTPSGLKDRFGGLRTIELLVEGEDLQPLIDRLEQVSEVEALSQEPEGLIKILTAKPTEVFSAITLITGKLGLQVARLTIREPTLEQAFVRIVEEGGS